MLSLPPLLSLNPQKLDEAETQAALPCVPGRHRGSEKEGGSPKVTEPSESSGAGEESLQGGARRPSRTPQVPLATGAPAPAPRPSLG